MPRTKQKQPKRWINVESYNLIALATEADQLTLHNLLLEATQTNCLFKFMDWFGEQLQKFPSELNKSFWELLKQEFSIYLQLGVDPDPYHVLDYLSRIDAFLIELLMN